MIAPGINLTGFITHKNTDTRSCDEEAIKKCREFIREYCTTRKTLNRKFSSYFLKHVCEKVIGDYVSNGDFIQAAILEGYRVEPIEDTFSGNINIRVKREVIDQYCAHSWVSSNGWY